MFNKIFPRRRDTLYASFGFLLIGSLALLAYYPNFLIWPFGQ